VVKLRSFFLGVFSASFLGFCALLIFSNFENLMERAKLTFLILVGLSTFMVFLLRDSRIEAFIKKKAKGKKPIHWASIAAARSPVKVESNTEEIQHLLEDLAIKAREANELIFQHKLDTQSQERENKFSRNS
jgi:hypothetical protein